MADAAVSGFPANRSDPAAELQPSAVARGFGRGQTGLPTAPDGLAMGRDDRAAREWAGRQLLFGHGVENRPSELALRRTQAADACLPAHDLRKLPRRRRRRRGDRLSVVPTGEPTPRLGPMLKPGRRVSRLAAPARSASCLELRFEMSAQPSRPPDRNRNLEISRHVVRRPSRAGSGVGSRGSAGPR